MDCRQVDRLLEANLDGKLSGFERVALRQHLKSCRGCRAKVEAMSAFAARVEKSLACDDGPDWRRLVPPRTAVAPPEPMKPEAAEAETVGPVPRPSTTGGGRPRPRADVPPQPVRPAISRSRRKPWSSIGIAACGIAIIVALTPFWPSTGPARAPLPWLEQAIAAEATRRAAGGTLDLATSDAAAAIAWFGDRGLPPLPALRLPPEIAVEGASLTYYAGARVAVLALATTAGPVSLHLHPLEGGPERPPQWLESEGLGAHGTAAAGWRAAVIGTPHVVGALAAERWLEPAMAP